MRFRHILTSFAFLFLFGTQAGFSAPEPPRRPQSFVSDFANVVPPHVQSELESVLVDLERKTGAELAVVTVETVPDGQIDAAAVNIFEAWGIGKKDKNNGVLFLVATKDRKTRIEVGYGLEGIIPDGKAGEILDNQVLPFFREGKMAEGIVSGALSLASIVASDKGVTLNAGSGGPVYPERKPPSVAQRVLGILFLIIMIPIVIRHPWILFFLLSSGRGGRWSGGGFGGGGFGGFGGGMSGGGGSSRGW